MLLLCKEATKKGLSNSKASYSVAKVIVGNTKKIIVIVCSITICISNLRKIEFDEDQKKLHFIQIIWS